MPNADVEKVSRYKSKEVRGGIVHEALFVCMQFVLEDVMYRLVIFVWEYRIEWKCLIFLSEMNTFRRRNVLCLPGISARSVYERRF
ncbi:hypothetical protein PSP6_580125 [Paraburkholderia tropica]|nr:hypothetical protein PSP6_580125 [Paraburkholderia tropica]